MTEDDLIQRIESDIDASDKFVQTVDAYEKDILTKLYNAKMKLDVL